MLSGQCEWDYHTHLAWSMSADEARSYVGIMAGMSDPIAPIPTTPSAASEPLPRLLGVHYDIQTASPIVGREVQQFERLRLFPTFDGSLPGASSNLSKGLTSFGGPFTFAK